MRAAQCPAGGLGTQPACGWLSELRLDLTSEFIQINEMKRAGSPDLITGPFILWSLIICAVKGCGRRGGGGGLPVAPGLRELGT